MIPTEEAIPNILPALRYVRHEAGRDPGVRYEDIVWDEVTFRLWAEPVEGEVGECGGRLVPLAEHAAESLLLCPCSSNLPAPGRHAITHKRNPSSPHL